MKTLVAIITYPGEIRVELLPFLADAARDNAIILPITRLPIDVARNKAVREAQRYGADVLIQLDADMGPAPGSYEALVKQASQEQAVAACPYTGTAGIPAFIPEDPTQQAATIQGTTRARMSGLAVSAFNMRVFDRVGYPWFEHQYSPNHSVQTNTEDAVFSERAGKAGVPIYVLGDYWAEHLLTKAVGRPSVLSAANLAMLQGVLG